MMAKFVRKKRGYFIQCWGNISVRISVFYPVLGEYQLGEYPVKSWRHDKPTSNRKFLGFWNELERYQLKRQIRKQSIRKELRAKIHLGEKVEETVYE